MNKKLLFLIFCIIWASPIIISAAAPTPGNQSALCVMVDNVKAIVWNIGGTIVIIGWAIAGILYLTAAGGERMGVAKKALVAAVIGTILVVISGGALALVQGALGQGGLPGCS